MESSLSKEEILDNLTKKVDEYFNASGNCAQATFMALQEQFDLEGDQILPGNNGGRDEQRDRDVKAAAQPFADDPCVFDGSFVGDHRDADAFNTAAAL